MLVSSMRFRLYSKISSIEFKLLTTRYKLCRKYLADSYKVPSRCQNGARLCGRTSIATAQSCGNKKYSQLSLWAGRLEPVRRYAAQVNKTAKHWKQSWLKQNRRQSQKAKSEIPTRGSQRNACHLWRRNCAHRWPSIRRSSRVDKQPDDPLFGLSDQPRGRVKGT